MSSSGPNFTKGIFSQLEGRFVDAHLSKEKKPRAKNLAFHYESSARKSKLLEQSGGGGGWVVEIVIWT